jgi:hypothetical protein
MNDTPLEHHAVDIITAVMALLVGLAVVTSLLRGFPNWYDAFLRWLQSWHLGALPVIVMILFILFDVALVGFIAFTMRRYAELVGTPAIQTASKELANPTAEIQRDWENIEALMQSQSPSDWNMAILAADALLDDTLRGAGYEGTTMAERLKIVDPIQLPSLDRVWSSHRLRNAIAHNPTDRHTRETIVSAINACRQALHDLGFMTTPSPAAPENIPVAETPPDQVSLG